MDSAAKFIKRILDICVATIVLVLLLPLFILVSITIRLETPGPVFFEQERAGYKGSKFMLIKFRSMRVHTPNLSRQTHLDDPNVTSVGRFIRRYKIDELPQLWNVLKGEMSLVGPRPTIPAQTESYSARQRRRLDATPGLTGWAQVNGNVQLSWDERIALDIWYIDNWSIWLDLSILAMTVRVVLLGERRNEGVL